MVDDERIAEKCLVIQGYLHREYPQCDVRHMYNLDYGLFHVVEKGAPRHALKVSREHLDDHTEAELLNHMTRFHVADVLRKAGRRTVLLTTKWGLEVEEDEQC